MPAEDIPTEADYIIIGGGTAGLVLANRLSEDPNVSVVVLEAGNDLRQDLRVDIPALWSSLLGSDADWNFQTTPQVKASEFLNCFPLDIPLLYDQKAYQILYSEGYPTASLKNHKANC